MQSQEKQSKEKQNKKHSKRKAKIIKERQSNEKQASKGKAKEHHKNNILEKQHKSTRRIVVYLSLPKISFRQRDVSLCA